MLPIFQKIDAGINNSFYVEHRKSKCFPNPFMFHPDVEILLVIQGTGTLLLGDSISSFGPGELVMIGPNTPHVWHSDEVYTRENSKLVCEAIFILFRTEIFGEQFLNLPESKSISTLISLSRRGIRLSGKSRNEVAKLLISLSKSNGFKRITLLLSILEIIASSKEYEILSSSIVYNAINHGDSDRLNKVYKYVLENFSEAITLDKVSSIANLSKSAFCHYFRKRTNKTFIHFLNEIRIAFACRLLTEKDQPVEKICYCCGYTNVSYFIRKFKEITGFTPLGYKEKYSE
jgi:AraC-like DNA-binding protein